MWGAIAGALAGSASDSILGLGSNLISFNQQKQWQKEVMQNQMQWRAEDLRKAGINPILGYTNGSSPSIPSTSMGSISPNFSRSLADVATAKKASEEAKILEKRAEKETELVEANIDKTNAEADEIRERTGTYEPSMRLTDANTAKATAEREKIITDAAHAMEMTKYDVQNKELQNAILQLDAYLKASDWNWDERRKLFEVIGDAKGGSNVSSSANSFSRNGFRSSGKFSVGGAVGSDLIYSTMRRLTVDDTPLKGDPEGIIRNIKAKLKNDREDKERMFYEDHFRLRANEAYYQRFYKRER